MPQRLDKLLADAGLGTRREVQRLIRAGRVTVGGRVVKDPSVHVTAGGGPEGGPGRGAQDGSDGDAGPGAGGGTGSGGGPSRAPGGQTASAEIRVDGEPLQLRRGPTVIMLNKPAGVITATADRRHRTVLDLLPPALARRLFPAGRLDKDTEGLLILTDDGELCHRLISPRHEVAKEYHVVVDGAIPPEMPEAFAAGVRLADGYVTRPAVLRVIEAGPPGVARVTVTEGKYHQVRRMFAAFRLTVTALRRVRIGGLRLDERLGPGEFRELSDGELELLLEH